VGTWKLGSSCILDSSLLGIDATELCATATLVVKKVGGTAEVTYKADHTYVSTGSIAIDTTLTVPTTCFLAGKTCADLKAAYAQAMLADPTLTRTTCSPAGSACVCDLQLTADASESGTYSTNLTSLSTIPAGQTVASTDDYCVQGNELHSISIDMTMPVGPMGMAKIAGDLVFTRQ
jgi:hypothetical protein